MNDTFRRLLPGEQLIEDGAELWLRQCTERVVDEGEVTDEAWSLSTDDRVLEQLSGSRMARIAPADANAQRPESVGLWALSVDEVAFKGLRCVDDEGLLGPFPPIPAGHAYVDWHTSPSMSRAERRDIRKAFTFFANERGQISTDDDAPTSAVPAT